MVKVNDTFKNLIPQLSTDEYSALEASILKEGVREAIILWGDFIVDGHNRYEIATRHGLPFKTTGREFDSEDEVIIWMIDNQLARRNINDGIKYVLADQKREALLRIGLKNKADAGGDKKSESARSLLSLSDKSDLLQLVRDIDPPKELPKKGIVPHNTQKEIAKTLGWSTGKVAQADVIFRSDTPAAKEAQKKVMSGELTIKAAYTEVKSAEKKAERAVRADAPPLPKSSDGRYDVIYADPPWRYDFSTTDNRKIENHYPTMVIEDICSLGIPAMCADDCVLFLWGTNPKLREALAVIEAWGFEYKTNMVWVKNQIGMGYYARQQHELLLIATKGSPAVPFPENRPNSAFLSPRENHSAKPMEYYGVIEKMYPNARKIELFSRKQVDGWDRWGNE